MSIPRELASETLCACIGARGFAGGRALIELAGESPPDARSLVADIAPFLDPDDTVTVLFTERVHISNGTTTSTVALAIATPVTTNPTTTDITTGVTAATDG